MKDQNIQAIVQALIADLTIENRVLKNELEILKRELQELKTLTENNK